MNTRLIFATAAVGVLVTNALAAAAGAAPSEPDPALARGAWVAQRDCAQCHAIGAESRSPNPNAPAFRDIRLRFNPISLERRLHPMPEMGHDAMPPRTLAVDDVSYLVAYIQSLAPAK